ncbi:AbrB/MazE/SpoVT family DNA-binding domain-containing protein [Paenibacillus agilis]|uniref:AbrB/MazE/SpoVT family DNA-binding domain-containing protein n=1 Tax=Paenibacillus agilis TaxID=3020863 RepID=A0A559ICZ9_9BACL|nr:AbrB/MazE/SpoVT family DNA-binding domain-containing protein [Paenibacillus agilis]TVX85548.1 AbrB/MazE/SpoVT family DNA-binding domain-containing protein [Paenibacillus agilis]
MSKSLTRPVGERGQVTIPKKVREDLKLAQQDEVVFIKVDDSSYLIKKINQEQLNQFLLLDSKGSHNISFNKDE